MSSLNENPNCARTWASFRLGGNGLIAAEITRQLGLEPDFAAEKAQVRSHGGDRAITQRTGVWSLRTEEALETTSIERHLLFLLERVEHVSDVLADVVESQALEVDFFCYWLSATGHGGPEISADTLRRIADVGATLAFDFYGPFPND